MTSTPTALDLTEVAAKLPEHARPAFIEGRRSALAGDGRDPAERELRQAEEAAERARIAREELLTERASRRWAMWCHQVPAIHVDERADCDRREPHDFAWWLSRLAPDQHADKIAAWLGDPAAKTLWLVGDTGNGKSFSAVSAGYAAAARAVHVRYVTQLSYLQQLRPGQSDDPMRVRQRFGTTSLLVLDDFGAETGDATQFVRQELLSLLDERLNEGRRQIITTNADAEALADTFGDRIMSRLRADAAVIKFEGADRRTGRTPW